jgi:hypothetical protein
MQTHLMRQHRFTRILFCAAGLICLAGCGQSADDAGSLAARDDGDQPAASDTSASAQAGDAPRERSISPRQRPAGDDDGEPQTRLIRTLDDALDEVDTDDEDVDKDDLRSILHEADRELRHVLGGKSKEAILRANRKPPSRYRHEPRKPVVNPEKTGTPEDAVTPEKTVTPDGDDAATETTPEKAPAP